MPLTHVEYDADKDPIGVCPRNNSGNVVTKRMMVNALKEHKFEDWTKKDIGQLIQAYDDAVSDMASKGYCVKTGYGKLKMKTRRFTPEGRKKVLKSRVVLDGARDLNILDQGNTRAAVKTRVRTKDTGTATKRVYNALETSVKMSDTERASLRKKKTPKKKAATGETTPPRKKKASPKKKKSPSPKAPARKSSRQPKPRTL